MTTIRTQYVEPVMFTCDAKNAPVATGHRMRIAEFAAVSGPRSFRCGGCGQIHTWTTETAWLGARPPVAA
jgi:hypothetical protein